MSDDRACVEWSDRLDLSANELSPADQRALADHLQTCTACRREQERGQTVRAVLLAGDPATELRVERSQTMRAALLERCEADIRPPAVRRRGWPWLLRWAALPVAAASALGVWGLVHRPRGGGSSPMIAPPTVVGVRPLTSAETHAHPGPAADGGAHKKRFVTAEERRLATGPSHSVHRPAPKLSAGLPRVRRAAPAPRLAFHPVRHRSSSRIAREILVVEASADRGISGEPPLPVRIAMGGGSSRPSQIAMGNTARRP